MITPLDVRRPGAFAAALLASFAAAACRENIVRTEEPTVSVETPVAWATGSVMLRVSGLGGPDTLPVVVIGRDTVAVRYAAPDSLIVTAPDTQGTFTIQLGIAGRSLLPVGTIQLAGGYAGDWTPAESLGGHPLVWPGAPQTSVAIARDSGVALVDPRTRTVSELLSDSMHVMNCLNGVGPAEGGRITVNNCKALLAVAADSPAVAPDSGPVTGGRFAVQMGSGRWLVAYHHGVDSYLRSPGGAWTKATTVYHVEEPYEVAVSPSGDRAIVSGRDADGVGMPVFSRASAEPAYLLTQFRVIEGAQFSPDGDTLYVVALRTWTDTVAVLAALRASDGTVLRSAPAWAGASQLVLDPGKPWIYLLGHDTPWDGPFMHVYRRDTFAPVAVLTSPAAGQCGDATPVLSAAERKLYVVESCSFCLASAIRIVTFDLMP